MADSNCSPITVEGDWSSAQTRTVINKLQLYFGSKNKSGGGECRVEVDSGTLRATVFFISAEARERVLARKDHEVVVEKHIFKLRLNSVPISVNPDGSTESHAVFKNTIVLGNIQSDMSRDLLSMLVENVSGLDESKYSLEIIWEARAAVVTFNMPADVQQFEHKLQSRGLTVRLLEVALCVRVEELPPSVVKGTDMLELYFEKTWSQPERIIMIAEEHAAIISFSDPEVVKRICTKQNHDIMSTPVKMYPFYLSLGSALYGMDRPTCQPPKAFIEKIQHAIWKFFLLKKLSKCINDQMAPYFCSVDLECSEVKLSPLPSLMRQPGVNGNMVEKWKKGAQDAFHKLLSNYLAFECTINAAAWKAAEKDVRLLVKEDAALVINAAGDLLTVAGPANLIKQIRAQLENIVNKTMSQIQRQTETVQRNMHVSPLIYHILQLEGLEKARQGVSPNMSISYHEHTQNLVIEGLPEEVWKIKDWILENKMDITRKQVDMSAGLLDFLNSLDLLDISQDIFISQGINVVLSIENKEVWLLGSSPSALNDAETKIRKSLTQQTVIVDDQEVLQRPEWVALNQHLLAAYNNSKKKTVTIQNHAVEGASILVSGFQDSVEEVSQNLQEFILNYSQVQENFCLKSCAVLQFITLKKLQEFRTIKEENSVKIDFDPKKPRMNIAGARINVQKAKADLQKMTSALATDRHVIDKPGARKYFLSHRSVLLSALMADLNCVVLPISENPGEEEDDGIQRGEDASPFPGGQDLLGRPGHSFKRRGEEEAGEAREGDLKQTTTEGLKIVLWKGNIEDQTTCIIVNTIAENLNLKQGAVAKALLQAAGPNLQSAVQSAGGSAVSFGDVVITDGFNLSCQKVFHGVCRIWDKGAGNAENDLTTIIRFCLDQAEKLQMQSLSFPAIGTGNLNFPGDLVCRTLLREIHKFSSRSAPCFLKKVFIVVHPTNVETANSFSREFCAWCPLEDRQNRNEPSPPFRKFSGHSQQSPVPLLAFGRVSSPSLGVYHMQMGQVTLEVSSGDITKEASDAIVNSSNQNFTRNSGVSKAILDSAGPTVQSECNEIVGKTGDQNRQLILTLAGQLPSKNIIHVFLSSGSAKIKEVVYSVLELCEENKFSSVTFPALGTGKGGANPSAAADAMLDAMVDFVRKKQPKFVRSIKILIFQTGMITEFHMSMKKREGAQSQEKGLHSYLKGCLGNFSEQNLKREVEQSATKPVVFKKEKFEPTVFVLCADNDRALCQAKQRIRELILAEHAVKTINEQYISQLSQSDMDEISALQRQLTVSISLEMGDWSKEPSIRLEGLTSDVFTADAEVRRMIQRVQRAKKMNERVQWHFEQDNGSLVAFDPVINLLLEEALDNKQQFVKVKMSNQVYNADVMQRKAFSADFKVVGLQRIDMKAAVPPEWEDMLGNRVEKFLLPVSSSEFINVEAKTKSTGLPENIISIERVQNPMLWQRYQLMKRQMEAKNKHKYNERQLFHGTDAKSVDSINSQGFDRGFAGQKAALYGKGSYFAVDPVYSARRYATPDENGHKRMFLARVLVGDFTQGKHDLITPPNKSADNSTDLYDSVTDRVTNPTMFVVFTDSQAYPEYLITFK